MNIDDMQREDIQVFHDVSQEYSAIFENLGTYLNVGQDKELIRYIVKDGDPDKLADVEKMKKVTWGRVSKASPIYEYDTDKKFIIEILTPVWDALTSTEKNALAYALLSRINVGMDKKGNIKFELYNQYFGEFAARAAFGKDCLPSPESIARRLAGVD